MIENNGQKSYRIQYFSGILIKILLNFNFQEDEVFMMGDNRNQSSDSRSLGWSAYESACWKINFDLVKL